MTRPEGRAPHSLSRRRLIFGGSAAVLVGALGVGATTVVQDGALGDRVPARRGAIIELPGSSAGMSGWRADVDELAAAGQTLVRCGSLAGAIHPALNRWDESAAGLVQQALDYARGKGMAINMVLPGCPDWAQSFSYTDYFTACRGFWSGMNDRLGSRVDVMQVYNEADGSHYRYFDAVSLDASYLGQLADLLGAARTIFHSATTMMTTNLLGWPMNDQREQTWYHVLDAIGGSLDIISLDLYPADNPSEIAKLPGRITRVAERYHKRIFVAEIGLQTSGAWTQADQGTYVSAAIAKIGQANPWGVSLYRWRDSGSDVFGIYREDRSPKSGRDKIVAALQGL